jgi:glycosyltransferase involved in cell wall biosynthesis
MIPCINDSAKDLRDCLIKKADDRGKSPQISVIMPVYNAERYVAEAVTSILAQDFRDLEFLIFDDGSNDLSPQILETFASQDDRIRYFRKAHKGYVCWLNEGIRLARGEFIARMDADDVSLPSRLLRQIEYLRKHTDCIAVGCNLVQIDSDGDPLGMVIHDTDHQLIEADLLSGGLGAISHPASMIRHRALVDVGGYREEYEFVEDFDLWLRLSERGKLANIPDTLFRYRLHHTNVIFTKVQQQQRVADQIISDARRRRGLQPLSHSIWNYPPQIPADLHQAWAWKASASGYHRAALKHAIIAVRLRPLSPRSWTVLCASFIPVPVRQTMKCCIKWISPRRSAQK